MSLPLELWSYSAIRLGSALPDAPACRQVVSFVCGSAEPQRCAIILRSGALVWRAACTHEVFRFGGSLPLSVLGHRFFIFGMHWESSVPLRSLTTFGVGGPADRLFRIPSTADLSAVFSEIGDSPYMVLGGGSNILFSDSGYHGAMLKMEIGGIEAVPSEEEVLIRAGAGVVWDELVAYTVSKGWWGLENLSGIPGTVGATPIQNVGAYGVEVKECIVSVDAYDPEQMTHVTLTTDECAFAYRASIFKHELRRLIITSVTYRLFKTPHSRLEYRDVANYFANNENPSLAEIRNAVIAIRGGKFPDLSLVGCAGSTFKNPVITHHDFTELRQQFPDLPSYPQEEGMIKIPLGHVLERLGWKGYRTGDAGVWKDQALIVVNYGTATARELTALIDAIIDDVRTKTSVRIEPEIVIMRS